MGSSVTSVTNLPAIRWHCRPWRDEAARFWPIVAAMIVLLVTVQAMLGNPWTTLLVASVLVIGGVRHCLPATYEVNDRGFSRHVFGRVRHIPWHAVQRCRLCRDGLIVFTRAGHAEWDFGRGTYIPWQNHQTAVISAVEQHVARQNEARVARRSSQRIPALRSSVRSNAATAPDPTRTPPAKAPSTTITTHQLDFDPSLLRADQSQKPAAGASLGSSRARAR